MGPVSAIRPVVQVAATSGQQTAGGSDRNGSALHNGAHAAPAAAAETPRPVAQPTGAERGTLDLPDVAFRSDHARDRVEAAQRAYMIAVRAAGMNPLDNPVP